MHSKIISDAHQTSARYPRNVSEFDQTGLDAQYLGDFFAPFVAQSRVKIGLELRENLNLKINNTELLIGEIQEVHIDQNLLMQDGFVDLIEADTVGVTGLDSYHSLNQGARYSYAKPDQKARKLTLDGGPEDQ